MSNKIQIAIIGGIFTLLGIVAGAVITGWLQVDLAKQKFNSELVMKALESESPQERLETLKLLIETNLLKDDEIKEGVRSYAEKREKNPLLIPQVVNIKTFQRPVISNPRIYLLTGTKSNEHLLVQYREELETAGYRVLGEKFLIDKGRPDSEEIRYFFPEDKEQAYRLAEVMQFKLSNSKINAKKYNDKKVNQGYIEIWLGK